jgi:hypothetical protein
VCAAVIGKLEFMVREDNAAHRAGRVAEPKKKATEVAL